MALGGSAGVVVTKFMNAHLFMFNRSVSLVEEIIIREYLVFLLKRLKPSKEDVNRLDSQELYLLPVFVFAGTQPED